MPGGPVDLWPWVQQNQPSELHPEAPPAVWPRQPSENQTSCLSHSPLPFCHSSLCWSSAMPGGSTRNVPSKHSDELSISHM
uniref:Uncharacterized protein n=1 Tax=Piliocolobus tephrosceles TaxID=591936 RepID=A0A8C9I7K5_9PRIM